MAARVKRVTGLLQIIRVECDSNRRAADVQFAEHSRWLRDMLASTSTRLAALNAGASVDFGVGPSNGGKLQQQEHVAPIQSGNSATGLHGAVAPPSASLAAQVSDTNLPMDTVQEAQSVVPASSIKRRRNVEEPPAEVPANITAVATAAAAAAPAAEGSITSAQARPRCRGRQRPR
jgi:hypothetical protein